MSEFDGFATRDVEVDGARIRCHVGGTGSPVLLLHGYPQNAYMWAKVGPALADEHTVVAADLRGYGASTVTTGDDDVATYSFRAMAHDQLQVMRTLGFDRFAVVGHDRGARVAHRLALDEPDAVDRLAVLDIVPTLDMWRTVSKESAAAYWHWYFLTTAEPFPERLIGADPDFFFETCVETWGATRLADLDAGMLDRYRADWRQPTMVHASCQDYRVDVQRRVDAPTLVLWGAEGRIARLFDVPDLWGRRCRDVRCEQLPGGHFFVDQHPERTVEALRPFLRGG
ncbi:MAG: alpha/beta hydrolase [Nocardioidaceae bacterium]|nr:alpha/beta hydrolase [Nocardioidaceae bacterium]